MRGTSSFLLFVAYVPFITASPAPTPYPHEIRDASPPLVTASPARRNPTQTYKHRRDILSDIGNDIGSVLKGLGSDIPTYAASGILPGFQNFPTGSAVQSSLSLSDSDVAALPTQALNLAPYANWTSQGWNVRIHGNIYKQPNITQDKLDDLANIFLGNTSISSLPTSQQDQARNLTAEIFVIQQSNVQPLFLFAPTPTSGTQVVQTLLSPYNTTEEGDYDAFSTISLTGLLPGNGTTSIQSVPMYVNNTSLGNATAYLVPPTGLTIVSDIDDILRVTKIYEPQQGLLNSFARPFTPWMNMPSIYSNWSQSLKNPQVHFHYLTTTPEQITRNYEDFIFANYPAGSFDTRPLNFSNPDETLSVRKYMLQKILDTFPSRKFVLVGDTTNSDIMSDYPALAHSNPNQIACILLRNTSGTDTGDKFPYDTSGFKGLNQSSYMFFLTPDDLTGLDISNGQCWNSTVKQNVTFGWQGLPGGLSDDSQSSVGANGSNGTSGARGLRVGGGGNGGYGGLLGTVGLVAAVAAALAV